AQACQPPRLVKLIRGRHGAGVACEAPGGHQRADGDVERAIGGAAEGGAVFEQVKQARLDAHRLKIGAVIDPTDLAVREVTAQLRVEPLDLGQRLFAGSAQSYLVRAVEQKLEARRHSVRRK